jgi:hypothetical protein
MHHRFWKPHIKHLTRLVISGLCLTLLALMAQPATAAAPAIKPVLPATAGLPLVQVQEGGFLKRLFRGRREKRKPQQTKPRATRPQVRRSNPRPPAQIVQSAPEIKQVEKNPDARRILVLGDFFGASLALGLAESFAQDRTVAIDSSTNGTSGFVRYDTFNWDAHLRTVLSDPELGGKADLIVVMMGGNDRQFFRSPQRISLDTREWQAQYEKNVDAFADQLAATNLPVIWVGMPPVRGPKTSAHLANLTNIYKSEAESIGARYVDIWDAFANEAGVYDDNGPDINGQQAQLRRSDGFGLSTAGREKLTFFVKRQVDRYLSGSGAVAGTPGGVVFTEDGPVIPLSGFALEDAISLKGGVPLIGPPMDPGKPWEEVSNAYNVLIRGVALKAPPTRADNFSWPPTQTE